jgi:hypothetical protein
VDVAVREAQTRDVVAVAGVDNDRARDAAREVQGVQRPEAPTLPADVAVTPTQALYTEPTRAARDLSHDPRTGPPDQQPTAQGALMSTVYGTDRHALAQEMTRAAGLDPNRVNTPDSGSVRSDAEVTSMALRDAAARFDMPAGTTLTPSQEARRDRRLEASIPPHVGALSAADRRGLLDPSTRSAVAERLGQEAAERRAMARTFGSPENVERVTAAWSAASPQARRDMADAAAINVDRGLGIEVGPRTQGAILGTFSAVSAVGAGIYTAVTPEPFSKVGGAIATVGLVDQAVAGFRQAFTGVPTETLVQQAAEATAEAVGVDPVTRDAIGNAVDFGVSLLATPLTGGGSLARQAPRLARDGTLATAGDTDLTPRE